MSDSDAKIEHRHFEFLKGQLEAISLRVNGAIEGIAVGKGWESAANLLPAFEEEYASMAYYAQAQENAAYRGEVELDLVDLRKKIDVLHGKLLARGILQPSKSVQ